MRVFIIIGSLLYVFFLLNFYNDLKDNGFAEMLYKVKWEVLPPKIQKVIMLLMHRKQYEKGLKMGLFSIPINRESFKMVIYFRNAEFLH